VDPALAPLLYAALSPEPSRRPDADEVVSALERYATGQPVTEALRTDARHTQVLQQPATSQWAAAPAPVPARAASPVPRGPVALPVDRDDWADQYADAGTEQGNDLVPFDLDDDEVSDWQAAWEGEPGEPDPRIGRAQRTGSLLALLALFVAAATSFPVVAGVVALLWSWVARTADRSVTSLVLRRHQKGRRRSDVPFAVAASPWHLVVGLLATVVSAVLPVVVGVCAVFSAALAMVAVTGGSPEPNARGPVAAGAVVAGLMAWWGPGGSGLRRGSRSLVRGVSPGRGGRVLVLLLLAAALGFAAWSLTQGGAPDWWPSQDPSAVLPGTGR
jgi:hypothetical protein